MAFSKVPGWGVGGFLPYAVSKSLSAELDFTPRHESEDEKWMFVALLEGMKGCGISNPNPSVGCVIVKDNQLIAAGATEAYRLRHAERVACSSTASLEGATAYVTLEPCSHQGYQPPCVDLFIKKKVARVVIASWDPFPCVNGEGIKKLRANGIQVEIGILKYEAAMWLLPFLGSQLLKRPIIIGKWAQTNAGILADDEGNSQWITNPISRSYGHWLRQKYDAILVGAGTALKDFPRLTVRDCREPVLQQPFRLILDLKGKITEINSSLLSSTFSEDAKTVLLIASENKLPKHLPSSVKVVKLSEENRVKGILKWIASEEANQLLGKPMQSLYVEGGTNLLNAFLKENSLDIIHQFIGDKVLPGTKHKIEFENYKAQYTQVSENKLKQDFLKEYVNSDLWRKLLSLN